MAAVLVKISYVCIFQSMFVILHITRGTPYMLTDQGDARKLTQWEQLDQGKQFTPTKKFLTIVPIVL